MDSAEQAARQAAGEAKVRALLIDRVDRLAVLPPKGVTIGRWEEAKTEISQRLWRMSERGLSALAEFVEDNPAGDDKNRWPVAKIILDEARRIEPPGDDAPPSALMCKIFTSQLGRDALEGGWAAELMERVTTDRRWPSEYAVRGIKESAAESKRRLQFIEEAKVRGDDLTPQQAGWLSKRSKFLAKAELAAGAKAEVPA